MAVVALLLVGALALRNPLRPADPRDLDSIVLKALNAARDPLINPALHKNMPDPMALTDAGAAASSSVCIVPNPFGGCICSASAQYSIKIDTVTGASNGIITNFTSAHLTAVNLTSYALTATATLEADAMHAGGNGDNAQAGVSACGISPTVYGTASSDANVPSAALRMTAGATLDKAQQCLRLHVDQATVLRDDLDMYNIQVNIDLGLFPLPISAFVNLFKDQISGIVADKVKEPIGEAIPEAVNPVLPCIPL